MSANIDKIWKYKHGLKNADTRKRALEKLQKIDVTVEQMSETGIGRVVNNLRDDVDVGHLAKELVSKWRSVAKEAGYSDQKPKKEKNDKEKEKKKEKPISFGAALSAACPVQKASAASTSSASLSSNALPKLTTADFDMNYRPLTASKIMSKPVVDTSNDLQAEDILKYKSTSRSRVRPTCALLNLAGFRWSAQGNIRLKAGHTVQHLLALPQQQLIQCTGSIPFEMLETILERATFEQLQKIEEINPSLAEDSDILWKKFFERDFPGVQKSRKETWKAAFLRLREEKQSQTESKLAMLRARIGSSANTTQSGRQAIVADVTTPRHLRKKQGGFGPPIHTTRPLPDALTITKARRDIFNTGDTSALRALPSVVVQTASRLGAHKARELPKKKGPLMLKTLKMTNRRR